MMNMDFKKNELIPAIVQDAETHKVLMLGYMNEESFRKTMVTKKVTFFSRSKKRLWTKGETSGHFLTLVDMKADCDQDTLLVYAKPAGPTCHKGSDTCWGETNKPAFRFLTLLEKVIEDRIENPSEHSYISGLVKTGINKIAQKVGEEAIEVVIESKDDNTELFLNESADLLFHLLILLRAKGVTFSDVVDCLQERHNQKV